MADSVGLNLRTGRVVTDFEHVVQSLEVLFSTARLSRVMRREYGSDIPDLIDAPMTDLSIITLYSAIATAVALWEPRIELTNIVVSAADRDGRVTLQMVVNYMPRGHRGDRTIDSNQTIAFTGIGGAFVALN